MMDRKLELLTIGVRNRYIGIDGAEIEKVVTGIDKAKRESGMIREFQQQGMFYRLSDFLRIEADNDYTSIIILKSGAGRNRLIAATGEMDMVRIDVKNILPVPDYIRKKKNPFLIWGFFERGDDFV